MRKILLPAVVSIAAGCASHAELKPGSSVADVERVMGAPAERVAAPGGDSRLYYPRGRQTYVATVGADGVVRSFEPRLNYDNIRKLAPNAMSAAQVRELLGPPPRTARMPRQQRDVWEYPWQNYEELRILWAQFSYDGTLREVIEQRDEAAYPQGGPGKD